MRFPARHSLEHTRFIDTFWLSLLVHVSESLSHYRTILPTPPALAQKHIPYKKIGEHGRGRRKPVKTLARDIANSQGLVLVLDDGSEDVAHLLQHEISLYQAS